MTTTVLDGTSCYLDVSDIVERIEHAEDIDAVALGCTHESIDDLIAVVPITHEVLASQQHLKRRPRSVLLDGAQPLPGILVQEAKCGIEGGAAPDLEGPIADAVHLLKDRNHVCHLHSCRPQGLMGVAQRCVGYVHGPHGILLGGTKGTRRALCAHVSSVRTVYTTVGRHTNARPTIPLKSSTRPA